MLGFGLTPISGFYSHIQVCAFISQKLNELGRLFIMFTKNFYPSIQIAKKHPIWASFGGYSTPPNRPKNPKFQIFHCFSSHLRPKRLDPGVVMALFCTTEDTLVNTLTNFQAIPTILPPGCPPPKLLTPFSQNSRGSGPIFGVNYTATLKAHQKKICKMLKVYFFRVTWNRCSQKNVDCVRKVPPITGPKCTPAGQRLEYFRNIKKLGQCP